MTRARQDGRILILMGSLLFLLFGFACTFADPSRLTDFRALYYPARCILQHHDPYQTSEVKRIFLAEGGDRPTDNAMTLQIATQNNYPPTTLSFSVPFALLPWGPAQILWIATTFAALIFASYLIWCLGADYSPILSGVLLCILLANSGILINTGNAAGITISLCGIAVWCFLRERFIGAGILCLAVSLAIKPHDAGLVWLYFLLAGRVFRKRALQTLAATIAISLPAVLWVWRVSPNWMQELRFNLLAYSAHGGTNDPRFAAPGPKGVLDLQVVVSIFRDDPGFYNSVAYLICAAPLLVWAWVTLRSSSSRDRVWLALAAIAPLSLLPVYHRFYDAKLLMLTVPACAMLWVEGGRSGRLALPITFAGLLMTGDLPWLIFLNLGGRLHLLSPGYITSSPHPLLVSSVPLALLSMSLFYLWIYLRRDTVHPATGCR